MADRNHCSQPHDHNNHSSQHLTIGQPDHLDLNISINLKMKDLQQLSFIPHGKHSAGIVITVNTVTKVTKVNSSMARSHPEENLLPMVRGVRLVSRYRFTSTQLFLVFRSEYTMCTCSCTVGKKEVSFSMIIGNEELMHECFPKHLRI